ncbi:LANO_0D05116g1_1 [Lachancea nothofagi CBS 11611]|uniref:LANO_0D05116g1_1 n=1 Tax=Lachancea nothofagi CBS 11611 TaxID=1266666 RepID=A0A1G4JGK9_9SACH|nr:LANO_0D05116g1_1 [Lachancea nothofagi CBS 11611]
MNQQQPYSVAPMRTHGQAETDAKTQVTEYEQLQHSQNQNQSQNPRLLAPLAVSAGSQYFHATPGIPMLAPGGAFAPSTAPAPLPQPHTYNAMWNGWAPHHHVSFPATPTVLPPMPQQPQQPPQPQDSPVWPSELPLAAFGPDSAAAATSSAGNNPGARQYMVAQPFTATAGNHVPLANNSIWPSSTSMGMPPPPLQITPRTSVSGLPLPLPSLQQQQQQQQQQEQQQQQQQFQNHYHYQHQHQHQQQHQHQHQQQQQQQPLLQQPQQQHFHLNPPHIQRSLSSNSGTVKSEVPLPVHSAGSWESKSTFTVFRCNMCEKSFRRRSWLKRHLLSHSSFKPYSCPWCQSRHKRRDNLFQHMKTKHVRQVLNEVYRANGQQEIVDDTDATLPAATACDDISEEPSPSIGTLIEEGRVRKDRVKTVLNEIILRSHSEVVET